MNQRVALRHRLGWGQRWAGSGRVDLDGVKDGLAGSWLLDWKGLLTKSTIKYGMSHSIIASTAAVLGIRAKTDITALLNILPIITLY